MINNKNKITLVPTKTLDSIIFDYSIKDLTYLRIDVEGHEYQVLKGAIHTLKSNPECLIHFELTQNKDLIYNYLTELDFKIFDVDFDGKIFEFKSLLEMKNRGDYFACSPSHPIFNQL